MNPRTLSAAVFATMLFLSVAGCKKKTPPPPPPPAPVPVQTQAPPPPPPPAPRIISFTGEPRTIQRGQSATLAWSVANATDISIDQAVGAVQANGNRQVSPTASTSYTLTARSSGGSDTRTVTVDVTVPPNAPRQSPPGPVRISGAEMLSREAQDAFFDYDKSDVRDDARTALTHDADVLKRVLAADPSVTVVIEGHCDERGSGEYNLGLGDRRSTSAMDFLVQLGVPAGRLITISYGKDRPQCTDANEACYQRNRRAHLTTLQK